MSVTSGWGRLTWDQSQWGGSTVLLRGWGARSWSENEWGELGDVIVTPTGLSATTSLGDSEEFNESGWGRQKWNNSGWGVEYSVEPTGVSSTTSLGTVVQGIAVPLEMVADPPAGDQLLKFARTSIGSVSVVTVEVAALTGVESTFATPTLSYVGTLVGWGRDAWNDNSWGESPDQVIPLVGREATASVGAIAPADVVGLSGQEATTNVGSTTFTIDSTPDITGQEATGNLGTLGLEFGPASISGVSASFNVGTLGLEFGPADITGVSSTASVGELTIDDAQIINLTGVQSTSAVGSIVPEIGVPLTGIAATSSTGSITPSDIMGLTGIQATFVDPTIGVQAYQNINTGSNGSFSNIDSGSNTSYSDESTGSNSSLSNVATGSNTSYSDAA